ncbi:hypothetical protein L596_010349 [Steinernema carpocapsae]|uniref:Uncharacterized protein n=1 Tax=Steinernema carpocapsae TaxID=34508 RepID=A0A4U5PID6_STECR|nr:hypothetical protein L596_010349 [Steinernema carpocapsae]
MAAFLFSEAQLRSDLPSFASGFSLEEEEAARIHAGSFIIDLVRRLNRKGGAQLAESEIAVAMIFVHRFFTRHSMSVFDFRDVAAISVFVAAKAANKQRTLDRLVADWWRMKFPGQEYLEKTVMRQLEAIFVQLETLLEATLQFELEVLVPHLFVANTLKKLGACKIVKATAYYYATDLLHITHWCLTYTSQELALVAIRVAFDSVGLEFPKNGAAAWVAQLAPSLDEATLGRLANRFRSKLTETRAWIPNISSLTFAAINGLRLDALKMESERQLKLVPRVAKESGSSQLNASVTSEEPATPRPSTPREPRIFRENGRRVIM